MLKYRLILLTIFFSYWAHAQYRDDIYQFSIFQAGSISKFKLTDRGETLHSLENLSVNHLSAVTNLVVNSSYIQMDLSFFLVQLTNSVEKNGHSSFAGMYGYYMNLNNPINLGDHVDLTIGVHGFMDANFTEVRTISGRIREQITVFGMGTVLDFLIGERLNIKTYIDYGHLNGSTKFGITSRVAYRLIGEQWFTITPRYTKYQRNKDHTVLDVSGVHFFFGLARNF